MACRRRGPWDPLQASLRSEAKDPKQKTFAVEVEQHVNVERKEVVNVAEPASVVVDAEQDRIRDLDAEDHEDPLMVAEYAVVSTETPVVGGLA